MNNRIGAIGSWINAFTVFCFAVFMLFGWTYGSFLVCIFLSMSFVCMVGALYSECQNDKKAAGIIGIAFSAIYATLIMIVYYTQCTTVVNEALGQDAAQVLNYKSMGLMFNLDVLGYGIMALSTFFIGLTINVKDRIDKALKILLLGHGLFFPGCVIMPMTGMFLGSHSSSSSGGLSGGAIALEIWCIYFLPIGILAAVHFQKAAKKNK